MRFRMLAVAALSLFVVSPVAAQKAEEVVRWNAKAPAAAVKPAGTATIELKAEIESGWYLYALTQVDGGPPPLDISVAKGQPFTLDKQRIDGPLPGVTKGSGTEPDTFHYKEKVTLAVPLKIPGTMKPGKHTAQVEVTYQVCSGSICLRPTTETLPVALTIAR
jgi:DsbC/DsbD-like thiol-disulfide interchange protein